MDYLFHDATGTVHLLSAMVALITGTWILATDKGTRRHMTIGYVYFGSMIVLNGTAFMIYRLFGGFGVFHIAALVSLVTVIAGMVPAVRRKPAAWLDHHLAWMYWSVIGLYAAFASEVLTRVPETSFFGMVGIATVVICIAGGWFFSRNKATWQALRD